MLRVQRMGNFSSRLLLFWHSLSPPRTARWLQSSSSRLQGVTGPLGARDDTPWSLLAAVCVLSTVKKIQQQDPRVACRLSTRVVPADRRWIVVSVAHFFVANPRRPREGRGTTAGCCIPPSTTYTNRLTAADHENTSSRCTAAGSASPGIRVGLGGFVSNQEACRRRSTAANTAAAAIGCCFIPIHYPLAGWPQERTGECHGCRLRQDSPATH